MTRVKQLVRCYPGVVYMASGDGRVLVVYRDGVLVLASRGGRCNVTPGLAL